MDPKLGDVLLAIMHDGDAISPVLPQDGPFIYFTSFDLLTD